MRFEVGPGNDGRPTWWLLSNDRIAEAGKGFVSRFEAWSTAAEFKDGAKLAWYETFIDEAGAYRWCAWLSSTKVVVSAQSFTSERAAKYAADNVRDHAGNASGLRRSESGRWQAGPRTSCASSRESRAVG